VVATDKEMLFLSDISSKMKVKQCRLVLEFHWFVHDVSNFFAELNNCLEMLEDYLINIYLLLTIANVMAVDREHF
jgi:hypothetical protein